MRILNIPQNFLRHNEAVYGFENLRLLLKDGHFYLYGDIVEDDEDRANDVLMIRYSYKNHWIIALNISIKKETLDKFVKICKVYYDLGDNIITLNEYGIMGE